MLFGFGDEGGKFHFSESAQCSGTGKIDFSPDVEMDIPYEFSVSLSSKDPEFLRPLDGKFVEISVQELPEPVSDSTMDAVEPAEPGTITATRRRIELDLSERDLVRIRKIAMSPNSNEHFLIGLLGFPVNPEIMVGFREEGRFYFSECAEGGGSGRIDFSPDISASLSSEDPEFLRPLDGKYVALKVQERREYEPDNAVDTILEPIIASTITATNP
jgi:hypothetical protein